MRFMIAADFKTQASLAKRSGVAQSTIGRILRGEVCPQAGTASYLAQGLGIPLEALMAAIQGDGLSSEVSLALSKTVEVRFGRRCIEKALETLQREQTDTFHKLETLRQEETEALDRLENLVRGEQLERVMVAPSMEAPSSFKN